MKGKFLYIAIFLFIICNRLSAQNIFMLSLKDSIVPYSTYTTIEDSTIALGESNTAKYILLDFYFVACKPCNQALKKIEKLLDQHSQKLNVISINPTYFDTKDAIIKHKKEKGIKNPVIYGEAARKLLTQLGKNSNTMGYPFFILINPKGKIIYQSLNSLSWHKKINKLLK
jgi:thiol-disulfide isomerase/thioredoxin